MNKSVVISSCSWCPHYDEVDTGACTKTDTGACTKTGTEWSWFDHSRGLIEPFPTDCPLEDINEGML